MIRRGEIYYADLSPVVGSEQGGVRPVLIVQNDVGNKFSPTVIAAAITSQVDKNNLPTHIQVDAESCGLAKDSVVLLEQVRTIDKQRLREKMGSLDNGDMGKDKYSNHITIGYEIKERIQNELGITVSVGASYNKVFAKFGSDYKKPNALTVVSKDNYKEIVWQKPVRELLFIGKATESKLKNYRINTIGELAQCEVDFLISVFGKNGQTIYNYANGFDDSPVRHKDDVPLPKSIGNSTTTPRDLTTKEQIKIVFASLADSVASRMRAKKLKCTGVSISIKDNTFRTFSTQTKLQNPTCLSNDLTDCAMVLLKKIYNNTPLRSVGITAFDLRPNSFVQYDLEGNVIKKEKSEKLEFTIDTIRQKYGNKSIKKGTLLFDESLSAFDTKKEHDISSFGKV